VLKALALSLSGLLLLIGGASPVWSQDAKQADHMLFDFEGGQGAAGWSALEHAAPAIPDPIAKVETSAEHATSGKQSLKITFAGGKFPAVISKQVPGDWMPWETFSADVYVSRPCVVGFCAMQEGSTRATGWDGGVTRWTKTEFCQPGKNTITAALHPNEWSAIRAKLENGKEMGKVESFEIFVYQPHDGDAIYVDNVRLLTAKEPVKKEVKPKFQVLGTDLEVESVQELGKKLADKWKKPVKKSADEVEADFRAKFDALKKEHPQAQLAIFRDGDKGYDPDQPGKIFKGWKDAYWSSHGPDGLYVERSLNFGFAATQEIFMRHRSPLFRVELSSIPKGSKILAAELVIVRSGNYGKEHSPNVPNMWVAEACNRPWDESEVNAFQYAKEKYWKTIGGVNYGEDGDFLPVYLAHGPTQEFACFWDFTEAVRFWTDGKHANHGFMLHGDGKDWFQARLREASRVANHPAVFVVYEKPGK